MSRNRGRNISWIVGAISDDDKSVKPLGYVNAIDEISAREKGRVKWPGQRIEVCPKTEFEEAMAAARQD